MNGSADIKENYLIYTAVTVWNEPPRARHQVANELKKDGVVYFVEKNQVGKPRLEIKKVEENVYVITPYFWLLYKVRYRLPFINEFYHHWLLKKIKKLNINFELVLSFDFTAPAIHQYFENVIFYSADDNVGFGNFNPWLINKYHTKTEAAVAKKAKVCIVTSAYMHTKLGAYNKNTHVVPLGAPPLPEISMPEFKKNEKPILGLVGYLDSNLHYPLIQQLLQEFTIHFIGPINNENRSRLEVYETAKLLGPKTGSDLYDALQLVDVCIAPYDETKINKGATPNKMWVYLALGKPVVVTNIPNIRDWHFEDKLVYRSDNNVNFKELCWTAYNDDTPDLALKRVELAKNNSWECRLKTIKELYYGFNEEQRTNITTDSPPGSA